MQRQDRSEGRAAFIRQAFAPCCGGLSESRYGFRSKQRQQVDDQILRSGIDVCDRHVSPVFDIHRPINHKAEAELFAFECQCYEKLMCIEEVAAGATGEQCSKFSGREFIVTSINIFCTCRDPIGLLVFLCSGQRGTR